MKQTDILTPISEEVIDKVTQKLMRKVRKMMPDKLAELKKSNDHFY